MTPFDPSKPWTPGGDWIADDYTLSQYLPNFGFTGTTWVPKTERYQIFPNEEDADKYQFTDAGDTRQFWANHTQAAPVNYSESTLFQFTPEAKEAIDNLKAANYGFYRRPGEGHYGVLTPQGFQEIYIPPERKSTFRKLVKGALSIAPIFAAPLTGGLAGSLGGGLAGTIGANALVSGGIGALAGQDPLKSALTGGLTAGIGSLVSPFASSIGADVLSSTGSQALADIASGAVKGAAGGLPSALISGNASNLLTGALTGGVGGATKNLFSDLPESVRAPVTAAVTSGLLGKDPTEAAIRGFAGNLMKSGPTMPGAGISEDIQEGFFEPGGPGFMPTEYLDDAEVQRELTSLLNRYPAPAAPSDWFPGENIMSGIPEWDMAAVNAGLPIGNLEQDFMVNERGQIVDNARNIGNFVNGEFVVDTGVTPNLSYASTGTPVAGKAPGRAQAPSNAASGAASSGFDPSLLFALGAMMTPQQQKKEEQQMAPTRAVQSPFGMDLLV